MRGTFVRECSRGATFRATAWDTIDWPTTALPTFELYSTSKIRIQQTDVEVHAVLLSVVSYTGGSGSLLVVTFRPLGLLAIEEALRGRMLRPMEDYPDSPVYETIDSNIAGTSTLYSCFVFNNKTQPLPTQW